MWVHKWMNRETCRVMCEIRRLTRHVCRWDKPLPPQSLRRTVLRETRRRVSRKRLRLLHRNASVYRVYVLNCFEGRIAFQRERGDNVGVKQEKQLQFFLLLCNNTPTRLFVIFVFSISSEGTFDFQWECGEKAGMSLHLNQASVGSEVFAFQCNSPNFKYK